jgi:glycosyltransferase involved in cell wall biosynthesis
MNLSVVILTFNSERTIGATLRSAATVSSDIHVVDSFSSDGTSDIARQFGAAVVTHPFVNYAAQRNWAIEHLPLRGEWELHLDADERLSDDLAFALRRISANANQIAGYHVARLVRFMGRPIRHGGMFPIWHMRCFRRGTARCESREYDQHSSSMASLASCPVA